MNITHRFSRLPWSTRGVFQTSPAKLTRHRATRIEPGDVLSLDGLARSTRVRCKSGQVWVTQAGKQEDVILSAGESFDCDAAGRVVVTSLERAVLVVSSQEA